MADIADVVIIGAGASGGAAAYSLADTKMRIVCLEQGDWADSAPPGRVSSQEQTGLNHVAELTPTVQRSAWAASFGGANGLEYLRVTRVA